MEFIHTADLHLGSSFLSASFDTDTAKLRREELFIAFENLINACIKRDIQMLLIAGDLFEDSLMRASDLKRVFDEFNKIQNVKVVICAGNHDYYHETSLYNAVELPDNVTLFKTDTLEKVYFEDINTCVYGLSFLKKNYREDILPNISLDDSKTNILLMHCDVLSKSEYLPIEKSKLEKLGFDYVALGHIHKSAKVAQNIVYPGSLEPLDFSENGYHGYIYGSIKNKKAKVKLIKSNIRQFEIIKVDITNMNSLDEIIKGIKELAGEGVDKYLYRVILTGLVNELINPEDVKRKLEAEFFYVEMINETRPNYDLKRIYRENKDNVIGLYIKELIDAKTNEEQKALYLGLDALLNEGAK